MSVTILMDPGKMRASASSLNGAAAKTRASANALGALSSPPAGVPASVAGRVTGAANRAKGALERQAALVESLADDLVRRAGLAYAAETAAQVTSWTDKVAGLAVGVGSAGKRYEDRGRLTRDMRRRGLGGDRLRNEVDRQMARKHGINAITPRRQAELERRYGRLRGSKGEILGRRRAAAATLAKAPLAGVDRKALGDIGEHLKKAPNAPLSIATTVVGAAGTLANPNLTGGQKAEKIAADAASAAISAAPAVLAVAVAGTGVGAVVVGGVLAVDLVTGGKVSEVSGKAGKAVVGGVKKVGKLLGKVPGVPW